jgi:uncharacterized membrane protein
MESSKNNYLIAGLLALVAIYSVYTKTYYNALGWALLSISLVAGIYLTSIEASKKYFYMALILPVIALICFALEIFY